MSLEALDPSAVRETEADTQSDAMKDQLRKDVASWREGRADGSGAREGEVSVAIAKPAPAPRTRRAKPAAAAPEAVTAKKKPFGMSYDGSSNADYINYMISRGAR
jgi:hypothetical protein